MLSSFCRRLPAQRRLSACRFLSIKEAIDDGKLVDIPVENIRTFSIIAHIDHGKSTLSDCLLQLSGNISDSERQKGQVLDNLKVERERGITVKAVTASMIFDDSRTGKRYLFNLIDTPGHIDFAYEVSRSLASCQGALLLVDSTQSIQAQTLANYRKATALGLKIIPVVTKIDLPTAQPIETALVMGTTFGFEPEDAIMTSAKQKIGIEEVIHSIIDNIPPPAPTLESAISKRHAEQVAALQELGQGESPSGAEATSDAGIVPDPDVDVNKAAERFMGRIVDSWFDEHRGVICLIQVLSGHLRENQRITCYASIKEAKADASVNDNRTEFGLQEIGVMTPKMARTGTLMGGQVGYVICGMRSTRQARVGDTMYLTTEWNAQGGATSGVSDMIPIEGYEQVKPMLFASIFPVNADEYEALVSAVDRLRLNDSSVTVIKDQSSTLGSGLRCGFLGFLHMEVFNQRLSDEFNIQIVITTPSVPYLLENTLTKEVEEVSSVAGWPSDTSRHVNYICHEPMVQITLVAPQEYYGAVVEIIQERRGEDMNISQIEDSATNGAGVGSSGQLLVSARMPWAEIVVDMQDVVMHQCSGYASFNYEPCGYQKSDLVKVEIAVNGIPCDPLSIIAHSTKAEAQGRKLLVRLKENLDRQLFEIILQAKIGAKILAKERLAPYRKDVLIKSGKLVGGGDTSRKKKLLQKQKEGKKRAKMVGRVEIKQEAFWSVLQR